MLPAVAQGAIGIEIRADDVQTRAARCLPQRRSDRVVRCSRARFPCYARGLLPHADCRAGRASRWRSPLSRRDPDAGRECSATPPSDGARRSRPCGSARRPRASFSPAPDPTSFARSPDAHPRHTARARCLGNEGAARGAWSRGEPRAAAAALSQPQSRRARSTAPKRIIATSRNGLRALGASAALAAALKLPVFTVGPGTTDLARELEFRRVIGSAGAARDLVPLIAAEADPAKGPLVHVAGEVIAFDIAAALAKSGFEVRSLTAYRALAAASLSSQTARKIADGALDAVILMSPRSADIFAQLVADPRPRGLRPPARISLSLASRCRCAAEPYAGQHRNRRCAQFGCHAGRRGAGGKQPREGCSLTSKQDDRS